MIPLILFVGATLLFAPAHAESPGLKARPARPPEGPSVVLAEFEVLPDCRADKVCSEGLITNIGSKTAYLVRLRVDVGGTKFGKPRTYFVHQVQSKEMPPGTSQNFNLEIDRRLSYKDAQKKDKIIEVGRFNFRVVPVWASSPHPTPTTKPK